MDFIIMIVVGFIVGLIARAIMPGKQDMGIIMTAILGIVGSVVGGFLARSLGLLAAGQAAGWIASIIGAIVVLFIYGLVTKNK
ncbi:GlsB/YeaQ/YmgE family stress response membrane protein [Kerstersia similis]|uniref:GlsB/YeaQ/YmgE family stress response membrane protein n=1 Tax=Kerstersia similis TaxID=206505 RepID=UPI0039F11244